MKERFGLALSPPATVQGRAGSLLGENRGRTERGSAKQCEEATSRSVGTRVQLI